MLILGRFAIKIYIIFITLPYSNFQAVQESDQGERSPIPITIKDDGIQELKKGDIAMIFYITVTNTGHEPVRLSVYNTRCCQTITKDDEDCESMKLLGGPMGDLFPQDNRNLTLIYTNLHLHNRVGSCDMEISDAKNQKISRVVKFNTTLVKTHVPRVLQHYYTPEYMRVCASIDEDPLNDCRPYICEIRYDGTRNFYNYTSGRCESLPSCTSEKSEETVAYVVNINSCLTLKHAMSTEEFADFQEGKPSATTLSKVHSYPINVHCHKGHRDPNGRWCECRDGWVSAPFNHKDFNPDVHVYHMCTVWTGEMSAEEARNITIIPKEQHKTTNAIVFGIFTAIFFVLCVILAVFIYKQKFEHHSDILDEEEVGKLMEVREDSGSESLS